MKLYDLTLSGNCHKVRLFLSLIGQPVELVPVNLLAGEHKQPAFREINPRGQIPVLEDGDFRLGDSQAILVYLAKRYANEWYPQDAETQGHIANWLSFAANEVQHGPATVRLGKLFGRIEGSLTRYSWTFVDDGMTDTTGATDNIKQVSMTFGYAY